MVPEVKHHPLSRADGSVTFSSTLFTIIAATNGPFEVTRRDELPEEAAIEVNIRSPSGTGGPAERWLESVVAAVLRSVLLVHLHPRTLIQVTLQVIRAPALKHKQSVQDIAIIPSLLNAAMLALIDGRLPLKTTMCAGLAVMSVKGGVILEPHEKDLVGCKSIHAFAYGLSGDLYLNESCGVFDQEAWQEMEDVVSQSCRSAMVAASEEDDEMTDGDGEKTPWLKQYLEQSSNDAQSWKIQA